MNLETLDIGRFLKLVTHSLTFLDAVEFYGGSVMDSSAGERNHSQRCI